MTPKQQLKMADAQIAFWKEQRAAALKAIRAAATPARKLRKLAHRRDPRQIDLEDLLPRKAQRGRKVVRRNAKAVSRKSKRQATRRGR